MKNSLDDARVMLTEAAEKLGEALDLLDPIPAAEQRGRAKALILLAKEILEKHISRRTSGTRSKSDSPLVGRAVVGVMDAPSDNPGLRLAPTAAMSCLDAT